MYCLEGSLLWQKKNLGKFFLEKKQPVYSERYYKYYKYYKYHKFIRKKQF